MTEFVEKGILYHHAPLEDFGMPPCKGGDRHTGLFNGFFSRMTYLAPERLNQSGF